MSKPKKKRLWANHIELNKMTQSDITAILKDYVIVTESIAVDVMCFQQNTDWVMMMLENGSLIVESWEKNFDRITARFLHWYSANINTIPVKSFQDATLMLPNSKQVLELAEIIDCYSIPKDNWFCGPYSPLMGFSTEIEDALGVTSCAPRIDILIAAERKNQQGFYSRYNNFLADQHRCLFFLIDGETHPAHIVNFSKAAALQSE